MSDWLARNAEWLFWAAVGLVIAGVAVRAVWRNVHAPVEHPVETWEGLATRAAEEKAAEPCGYDRAVAAMSVAERMAREASTSADDPDIRISVDGAETVRSMNDNTRATGVIWREKPKRAPRRHPATVAQTKKLRRLKRRAGKAAAKRKR